MSETEQHRGIETGQETARRALEEILSAKNRKYEALSQIDPGLALTIAETRLINSVTSSDSLGRRISQHKGLTSVDLVVLGHTEPSRNTPEPPCMIECYSLYAVLEGDDRRVVRIAYNIAEVWRGKRFGRAYAQKPTQEEMDRPGFDPMSMLRQEVISHNYERLDPLADVKLDATAAAYLRAAHKAAGGARVTYHFSDGENSRSEDVNEETLVQKEEAGRFARFRAEGCITESIPEHILKYESAGSRN